MDVPFVTVSGAEKGELDTTKCVLCSEKDGTPVNGTGPDAVR